MYVCMYVYLSFYYLIILYLYIYIYIYIYFIIYLFININLIILHFINYIINLLIYIIYCAHFFKLCFLPSLHVLKNPNFAHFPPFSATFNTLAIYLYHLSKEKRL